MSVSERAAANVDVDAGIEELLELLKKPLPIRRSTPPSRKSIRIMEQEDPTDPELEPLSKNTRLILMGMAVMILGTVLGCLCGMACSVAG